MNQYILVIKHTGEQYQVPFDELHSHGWNHALLHKLYQNSAKLFCTCSPGVQIPLRISRLGRALDTYCVSTMRSYANKHDKSCQFLTIRPHPGKYTEIELSTSEPLDPLFINFSAPNASEGSPTMPSLSELNDAQRAAATHMQGPCIVVAAAGSGKTAMLIERIKHLIDSGVQPGKILACTFTKKASSEMQNRVSKLLGSTGKSVSIGTIHSIAYKMLIPVLGTEWRLLSNPDRLIERILEAPHPKFNPHGIGNVVSMNPASAALSIHRLKSDGKRAEQVDGPIGEVYRAYEAIKQDRKCIDFEDLLIQSIQLLQGKEEFRKKWQSHWDFVMVDEFQDTNLVQWEFLLGIVQKSSNLLVVGDDWQSIYGFRGAQPSLMKAFVKQFLNAKKVILSTNYRSNDLIVELGNKVISLNHGQQIEKQVKANRSETDESIAQVITVKTDLDEAKFVADEIVRLHEQFPDIPYSEYAILYRTNIQSRVFEEVLLEREIPYFVLGNTHFYENPNVQTVLDYLRTTLDQTDTSVWVPLLNRPKRFIPRSVVEEVEQGGWNTLISHEKCKKFVQTIAGLSRKAKPADAILWLIDHEKELVKKSDNDEPIRWVDALVSSASRYDTIPEFLQYVEWVIEKSKEPKNDAVHLMTIHMSKGLEMWTVFVTGMAEGLLPHKNAIDEDNVSEETRLCYVAITRAKENIYLIAANQYGGKELPISRYIKVLQKS